MYPKGRPSKLTPEVQDTICKYLRAGNPFKTACEASGISYATGKQWRQRGEDRHPDRESGEDFVAFVAAAEKAEAEALARCAAVVQKAAIDGSVQAATWFLERRAPAEWGRVDRHVIARDDNEAQQLGAGMSIEQLRARVLDIGRELGLIPAHEGGSGDFSGVTLPWQARPGHTLPNPDVPRLEASIIDQRFDVVNDDQDRGVLEVEARDVDTN